MLLLLFPCRNGSGSSSGSREQSPTYQNWNHHSITNIKTKDNTITGGVSVVDASKKTNNSASDCTSSTECNSEGDSSDRNSDNNVYNVKAAAELGALSKEMPLVKEPVYPYQPRHLGLRWKNPQNLLCKVAFEACLWTESSKFDTNL